MTENNTTQPKAGGQDTRIIEHYITGSDAVRNMIEADHPAAITERVRALADRHRPRPQRTWTQVGSAFTTPEHRPDVLRAIGTLRWRTIAECGSLPAFQASAITIGVRALGLPNVSALALSGLHSTLHFQGEDYTVYGIEAQYANGRARLYVLDRRTVLVPLVSDFWPAHLTTTTSPVPPTGEAA
jgi:hypothetical protein